MKNLKLVVAVLISIALTTVAFKTKYSALSEQNRTLANQLDTKDHELASSKTELQQVQKRLILAENKLGYLEKFKSPVQVTAYTSNKASSFANGNRTSRAYAVLKHTLPEDRVVNVALSSTAQTRLHAKLNDYLVLIQKKNHRKTIAHFVDTTPTSEKRAVVDIYFADNQQALLWGRQTNYYAVNISSFNSPFKGVFGH